MARLCTDENVPLPTVEELRGLGHDVLTLAEAGNANQAMPDADVLAWAADAQRVLITLNRRHFIRLHDARVQHAGILVCTFDPDFVALAQRIDAALATRGAMANQLVRINRPG